MNKTTFPTSFCLRAGKHKRLIAVTEFCRNTIIQRIFLELYDCRSPIDRVLPRSRTTCVGWLAKSKELMLSKPKILNCTTQSLKNRQSNWSINRLIPRDDLVPLQQGFQKLKILSVDRHLPCLFLCDPCPCLCVEKITARTLFRWANAKSTFTKAFIAFRKAFLAPFSFGPPSTIFF